MSAKLTHAEATALVRATAAIVSPAAHVSLDMWRAAVNREVAALVGADSAGFLLPAPGLLPIYSAEHDAAALARFDDVPLPPLRDGRHPIAHVADLGAATLTEIWMGEPGRYLATEHYNDLAAPNRAHDTMIMATELHARGAPGGVAAVLFWHERPRGRRFGVRERELLQLAVPALKAGTAAALRVADWQADISTMLSELVHPALVCDSRGHVVHRTPRLERELAEDSERERLVAALQIVATSLVSFGRPRPSPMDGGAQFTAELETVRARYAIHGSVVPSPIADGERLAIAGLERLTPVPLGPTELQQRYGLTPAEVKVATLLATGASTADVATRLFLSHHTVRRHSEAVLRKVQVSSRTELATRLLR